MTDRERIRPFSCGSQYVDWTIANCHSCSKAWDGNTDWRNPSRCEIEDRLLLACFNDGMISPEIAKRMGYPENGDEYIWPCPEHNPPFGRAG